MCTVSLVPLMPRRHIRIACNRDESPLRAAAHAPEVRRYGTASAILPIDPVGGGTWIAVSDAGLAFTLMNRSGGRAPAQGAPAAGLHSRGEIIPLLLPCATLGAAIAAALLLSPERYPPFRLVLADSATCAALASDGATVSLVFHEPLQRPVMFASSGLGDALVDAPRRALFHEMVLEPADLAAAQDRYHAHSWPDRPAISVCTRRAEAQTVSLTLVDLLPAEVRLAYHAGPPDMPAAWVSHTLPCGRY